MLWEYQAKNLMYDFCISVFKNVFFVNFRFWIANWIYPFNSLSVSLKINSKREVELLKVDAMRISG